MSVRACTRIFVISVALLVLPCAVTAQSPIVGLFNTGVDGNGNPVADTVPGGTMDAHYNLILSADPNFPGPAAWVVNSANPPTNLFPNVWLPNATAPMAASNWISPRFDAAAISGRQNAEGNYVYRTTFDLNDSGTNCLPATARIIGRWLTDNDGLDIRINGVSTGQSRDGDDFADFQIPTSFVISSGFVAGVNTVDFVVNNAITSPTGLRVEMTGIVLCQSLPFPQPDPTPAHVSNWLPNVGFIQPEEQPLGDMWTFLCPPGGTVTARVDTKDDTDLGQSRVDPVLRIVDGQGNLIAQGDDEVACTYTPRCGFSCPQVVDIPCGNGQPHSIIVRDFGFSGLVAQRCEPGGGYELTVEARDRFNNAVQIRLGGGAQRNVPAWAVQDGKAAVGPALDDENVPKFGEPFIK